MAVGICSRHATREPSALHNPSRFHNGGGYGPRIRSVGPLLWVSFCCRPSSRLLPRCQHHAILLGLQIWRPLNLIVGVCRSRDLWAAIPTTTDLQLRRIGKALRHQVESSRRSFAAICNADHVGEVDGRKQGVRSSARGLRTRNMIARRTNHLRIRNIGDWGTSNTTCGAGLHLSLNKEIIGRPQLLHCSDWALDECVLDDKRCRIGEVRQPRNKSHRGISAIMQPRGRSQPWAGRVAESP